MNQAIANVVAKALPSLSGSSLTYNPNSNLYLTRGYTSAAGNTYFRAIRFSDRLVIYYEIGKGYIHTFLDGITLYAWNGQKANMIARRTWDSSNWRIFNEWSAKEESIKMLKGYLAAQAKANGYAIPDSQLLEYSRSMVEEAHRRQIA